MLWDVYNFEVVSKRIVYKSYETHARGHEYEKNIQKLNVGETKITEIVQRQKHFNFLHNAVLALLNYWFCE